MKLASKILGPVLIAALAFATGARAEADHATQLLAAPGAHPASCHAHSSKSLPDSQPPHSPQPAPVSYQCCLSGHGVAVMQASRVSQPTADGPRVMAPIEPVLAVSWFGGLGVSMVLSAGPPGTPPLRI